MGKETPFDNSLLRALGGGKVSQRKEDKRLSDGYDAVADRVTGRKSIADDVKSAVKQGVSKGISGVKRVFGVEETNHGYGYKRGGQVKPAAKKAAPKATKKK